LIIALAKPTHVLFAKDMASVYKKQELQHAKSDREGSKMQSLVLKPKWMFESIITSNFLASIRR